MKKRIIIYLCLFVLLAGGLVYIGQREQEPTGRGAGWVAGFADYHIAEKGWIRGSIYRISISDKDYMTFYVYDEKGVRHFCCVRFIDEYPQFLPLITMAFQLQSKCNIRYVTLKGKSIIRFVYEFQIIDDYITSNVDILKAIKQKSCSGTASTTSDGKVLGAITKARDDIINSVSIAKSDIMNSASIAKNDITNVIAKAIGINSHVASALNYIVRQHMFKVDEIYDRVKNINKTIKKIAKKLKAK